MFPRLSKIPDWEKLAKAANFRPAVMAALCPVSLRQMERFFVQHFNQTPLEWARQLRCRCARQLIMEGWANKAVVAELRFANESHLCHEFQRFYAVSPQSFAPLYGSPPGDAILNLSNRTGQSPSSSHRLSMISRRSSLDDKNVAFRPQLPVARLGLPV